MASKNSLSAFEKTLVNEGRLPSTKCTVTSPIFTKKLSMINAVQQRILTTTSLNLLINLMINYFQRIGMTKYIGFLMGYIISFNRYLR